MLKNIFRSGLLFAGSAILVFGADAAAGKKLYDAKCKSCHGADGKGNPAIAKTMKVEMKSLADAAVKGKGEAALKKATTEGAGKMKGVKLTDGEWADLYAHWKTM
jgi:cytochrome c553